MSFIMDPYVFSWAIQNKLKNFPKHDTSFHNRKLGVIMLTLQGINAHD